MSDAESAPDVRALEERIEELEARVAELEADDTATAERQWADHYDEHVLDELTPGQQVNASTLQSLYRSAGVRQQSTLRDRVKMLVTRGPFEDVSQRWWVYTGGDGDV